MSKRLYPDIGIGEGVRVAWESEDLKFACCDCNLVHRLEFRVEGNEVIISGWRDNRATAQLRRRRGIPLLKRDRTVISGQRPKELPEQG